MKQKTAKCKQCKTKHEADDSGRFSDMQSAPSVMGLFCREKGCLAQWVIDNPAKLNTLKSKAYDEETKALKAKVVPNDTAKQHSLTRTVFNKMRVLEEKLWFKLLGKEPECISCGKTDMDWCCGHFKTVGSSGHLRYDRKNTYLQCNRYCNMGLSGNISGNKTTRGYKQGLIDRFGEVKAQEINDYCEVDRIKKWDGKELIEMRKQFNAEIRRLEKLL